jgi:hypothetical protein
MQLPLRKNHVESVTLVEEDRQDLVVQFSKNAFGRIRIEAWGAGKSRLFTLDISPDRTVTMEHVDTAPLPVSC